MRARSTGSRRAIAWMLALVLCVAVGGRRDVACADTAAPQSPEYLIKAAYLYNFAMFVDWPAEAFRASSAPIVIGVVGADPFGWALDKMVQDKRINNRPIVIERFKLGDDLKGCHILFVSPAESGRIGDLVQRVGSQAVLIVGDESETVSKGSTIAFTVKNDKVGFEINLSAARRARLTISSKLLNLAQAVRG
jgi:uncharacterized protein DUF4154